MAGKSTGLTIFAILSFIIASFGAGFAFTNYQIISNQEAEKLEITILTNDEEG